MTLWINGDWVMKLDECRVKTNPVSGNVPQHSNGADATRVAQACQTARAAFVGWTKQPLNAHQIIVEKFALLLESNKAELTQIIAKGTGKPHQEVAAGLTAIVNKVAIFAEAYHTCTDGQHGGLPDGAAALYHRPHGMLAIFGPYSFPGHSSNGRIVPALLAGDMLIFKPSELTPWTDEAVTGLWERAGLPPGVLNLMQGGREAGQALGALEDLDGLLLIGNANIGYQLHKQLSSQPERILTLGMGGNDLLIVENSENIDAAAHLTIQSAFVTAEQHCTCARCLLVKKGAQGDTLLIRLMEISQRLAPGNWDAQPQPFMGRLISGQAAQHIYDAWQHLASLGGYVLLTPCLINAKTSLLALGIIELTGARNAPDEEVFGPLLGVRHYDSFDNAIRLANGTRFRSSRGLISPGHGQFEQLLSEAQTGIVNWNKPLTDAANTVPFDGVGTSGNHCANTRRAADYCAWLMASLEFPALTLPTALSPRLDFSRKDEL